MTELDAPGVADIYRPIIEKTAISFELEPPDGAEMSRRFKTLSDTHPWLVLAINDCLQGYAYAAPFKMRAAYNQTAEVSLYLAQNARQKGYGRRLLSALLSVMPDRGFKQAIATIALPNEASISLFNNAGFKTAGHLSEVGYKFGRWHDIRILQKAL